MSIRYLSLIALSFVALCLAASALPAQGTFTLEPLPSYRGIENCTSGTPAGVPCRVTTAPSAAEAERRLSQRAAAAWHDGSQWSVVYRAPHDSVRSVFIGGGIQLPLSRIPATRLWTLTLRLADLDEAVISTSFFVDTGGGSLRDTSMREWRGPRAPQPRGARQLAGSLRDAKVYSRALKAWRGVTVYQPPRRAPDAPLPVVYLADGQNVRDFAPEVDAMIADGTLRPVALVGVWVDKGSLSGAAQPAGPEDDLRAISYHAEVAQIPGVDTARIRALYRGHRALFLDEVPRWAEQTLGVSAARQHRFVQGNSSGASYVMTLGREHPEQYGCVMAASNSLPSRTPRAGWNALPAHHLSAGALEPRTVRELRTLADSLRRAGVRDTLDVYPRRSRLSRLEGRLSRSAGVVPCQCPADAPAA